MSEEVHDRICEERRRTGWGPRLIASGDRHPPCDRLAAVFSRRGLSRRPTAPKEAVRRFEWPCPGDLLQMDTKRFARFTPPVHAVTGDRSTTTARMRERVGYEIAHSMIDDHSRRSPTPSCIPTRRAGQVRTWVGLDVHAAKVVAAIADQQSGELAVRKIGGTTGEVADFCAGLPAPVRVAYEAGPTGFGLARALQERGIACVIAAPGKIERPAQDRVKTDRRDAERLVRLLMIGGLHPVRVPSPLRGDARPRPRPRGCARRSDAGPSSGRQVPAAPRPALRGQQLDGAPS